MKNARPYFILASVYGLTGVGLGAFGAHALKPVLSATAAAVFETGVRYQMYHAFALFAASWALGTTENKWFLIAARFFAAGVVLFCGSLYLLASTTLVGFGYVTPVGGLFFLAGWALMAYGFWNEKAR